VPFRACPLGAPPRAHTTTHFAIDRAVGLSIIRRSVLITVMFIETSFSW